MNAIGKRNSSKTNFKGAYVQIVRASLHSTSWRILF